MMSKHSVGEWSRSKRKKSERKVRKETSVGKRIGEEREKAERKGRKGDTENKIKKKTNNPIKKNSYK